MTAGNDKGGVRHMPIIAVATTKGGSGKTTLAMCLAHHWLSQGLTVEALDTDPNRNLKTWVGSSGVAMPCEAIGEDDVLDAAAAASSRADMVLIDVAGANARALLYGIGAAKLVLIPCRPDSKDVIEAARTHAHVVNAIKAARIHNPKADIRHGVVLTQVNNRAQVTEHSRAQLQANGLHVLEAVLPMRTAHQQASYRGSPIDNASVADDVAAIAAEVMHMIGVRHASA
ncbi:MAG TPA: ParA family protein [Azospirillaceae bacterium]|nr:ParA family protein [Azospirillaceae bacterium]